MNTGTYTSSRTDTFTEASARYVLGKIFDDFNGVIFRGFSTDSETIRDWRDDVAFVMMHDALYHFELQFKYNSQKWAVRYEVDKYGGISRDDDSGGVDFYSIPSGATVHIVMKNDKSNETVNNYLARRGWTSGGGFIAVDGVGDKAYSRNGYGVNRKMYGDF